ncbi:hypothetical protein L596_001718 [Steinernema carpocapsae]|uniref:Uncharacterized protein n=1 Tax=Steinernema carpocapsae TaxID=34508 RepID=A0A4V6I7G9_STECR|nr:hypothetical protein L596_001718 [Steinernema carpocapsae]
MEQQRQESEVPEDPQQEKKIVKTIEVQRDVSSEGNQEESHREVSESNPEEEEYINNAEQRARAILTTPWWNRYLRQFGRLAHYNPEKKRKLFNLLFLETEHRFPRHDAERVAALRRIFIETCWREVINTEEPETTRSAKRKPYLHTPYLGQLCKTQVRRWLLGKQGYRLPADVRLVIHESYNAARQAHSMGVDDFYERMGDRINDPEVQAVPGPRIGTARTRVDNVKRNRNETLYRLLRAVVFAVNNNLGGAHAARILSRYVADY